MNNKYLTEALNIANESGLLPLRKQAAVWDEILIDRLDTVLPELMRETEIDMWLILSEEFHDDPVLKSFLASDMIYAPRLTGLIFYYNEQNQNVDKISLYGTNAFRSNIYDGRRKNWLEDQFDVLNAIIKEKNPKCIGINKSKLFAHCDGLSLKLENELMDKIDPQYAGKLVSAEKLCIRWLETRTPKEMIVYKAMLGITRNVIKYVYSDDFIVTGVTTTDDLEWEMRQKFADMGFEYWFGPDVDLQRQGESDTRLSGCVINRGDLLHCDVGITAKYIPLNTDIQQLAYILRQDETSIPQSITEAFHKVTRLQNIISEEFQQGITGNELLMASRRRAIIENINPTIYTHPVGYHGHGAGANIGKHYCQENLAGVGELEIHNKSCYALEHNICTKAADWQNQNIYIYIEEDIYFDDKVTFFGGRQEKIIII